MNILGILISLLVLNVCIIIHEFGHYKAAKKLGVKVKTFSIGFGPRLFGFKRGDTDYRFSLFLLGGYVEMVGEGNDGEEDPSRAFCNKSKKARAAIISMGVIFNFLAAILLMTIVNLKGSSELTTKVVPVPDSSAAKVLVEGDKILKVNGTPVKTWNEMGMLIQENGDNPVNLVVLRGKELIEVTVIPYKVQTNVQGMKMDMWVIGVKPSGELLKVENTPVQAFTKSVAWCGSMSWKTFSVLGKMIVGKADAKDNLGGPVMIVAVGSGVAKAGLMPVIFFAAMLNLILGLMNILPYPILDGGHLLFLGIETIRGKPISPEVMALIQKASFFLLIILGIIVLKLDISRFFG